MKENIIVIGTYPDYKTACEVRDRVAPKWPKSTDVRKTDKGWEVYHSV